MISGAAKLAGVLGWPVAHSLSPRLHNYWIAEYGLDAAYVPLAVEPKDLQQVIEALPRMGFFGVNLTLPHKEAVVSFLDHASAEVQAIGAANTLVFGNPSPPPARGRVGWGSGATTKDAASGEKPPPNLPLAGGGKILFGMNTDAYGFSENIRAHLPERRNKAVVLGAGGATRAVCYALAELGFATIHIVNRSQEKAQGISALFPRCSAHAWEARESLLEGADLLVNTTSLGMAGAPPLELDLRLLPTTALVTDIVYTPLLTPLLQQAKARGNPIVDGLGMLLHQAVPAFEAWFGIRPEVTPAVRHAVLHG